MGLALIMVLLAPCAKLLRPLSAGPENIHQSNTDRALVSVYHTFRQASPTNINPLLSLGDLHQVSDGETRASERDAIERRSGIGAARSREKK